MSKKICGLVPFVLLVLLLLSSTSACSGGTGNVPARAAAVAPAAGTGARAPLAKNETATRTAPLEYHDDADERDRVFIENAELAIAQYSEFIAHAGQSEEYAPAVKRSRAQIEDLHAAIDFVRAGAQARAAH
ncbi:MAG TPA: hypothetical protein VGJ91_06015 [Polyangiaceae bacterium]|jgi:hypothetical protein